MGNPTVTPITENRHDGGFIVSEANGHLSRDQVVLTGGAKFIAGTVLGEMAFGVPAGVATVGAKAYGTINIGTNPAAGDTVSIAGTTITFETSGASGNQVNLGSTAALTAAALLAMLQASQDTNLVKCTYAALGTTGITVTAAAVGTGGNNLALATSVTAKITLSGAYLTGGTHNTGNATIGSITAGLIKTGTYLITCLTATTFSVYAPDGEYLGAGLFGTPFTDIQVNFTITAGNVACIAGDTFTITTNAAADTYTICTSSATDGSQVAAAILFGTKDVTNADSEATIMSRECEVNLSELIFDSSVNQTSAIAQLAGKGIICR